MSLGGYTNFKTPFYEIKIGNSSGQKLVNLPHHVLRLVDKVEIYEPLGGTEGAREFTSITLTFIEGSREPASPDASQGTSGLYKIENADGKVDMDIAGSLTNRTGIITDLRFSGNHGITFITAGEKRTNTIDTQVQENVVGDYTTRKWKTDPKAPAFLFNERNQVQVQWGYKEDPATWRTVRCYIIMVAVDFPEQGQIKTTVTCQDTGAFLDQIAPKQGTPFGKRVTSPKGNSIVVFDDLKTDEVLRNIAKDAGMAAIISTELPADKMDEDKQKMWIAGESFAQFMDRLARLHNCYWKAIPDPKTGKDTLVFIKKSNFESRILKVPDGYMTYRGQGSILKSVNVKVDFGGMTGATVKSTNANGEPVGDEEVSVRLFQSANKSSKNGLKPEEALDANPVSNNPIGAAVGLQDKVAKGGITGNVEHTPRSDKESTKTIAGSETDRAHRLIQLDFTTLGYTKLTPGTIRLDGLGVRYSGLYRILTVQHSIDSSGYTTKCTATSQFLPGGGARPQEAVQNSDDGMVDIQLFRKMQGIEGK